MSDSLAGSSRVVAKARMAMARAMPTKISYEEAVADPRFRESMLEELSYLFRTGAVKVVPLPPGRKAISSTWVHKLKTDADGNFTRARSRLCPHGFKEVPGLDFDPNKTEAPTLSLTTVMLVLILQVYRKMKARQHDVKKAFTIPLNHSETYMEAPKGMQLPPGHVVYCSWSTISMERSRLLMTGLS
jgi:hypothetical protein